MVDKVGDPTEIIKKTVTKGCLKRLKESKKVYKKQYFFVTCLMKLGTFIAFMVVSGQKFHQFLERPEYIAVCEYVISEELEFQVEYSTCKITVDQKRFTCNTEYGNVPSGETYDNYNRESGYRSSDTSDPDYHSRDPVNSGYHNTNPEDSAKNASDTGYTGYDGNFLYNSTYTAEASQNTGADQHSSSSADENIPPSGSNRRALRDARSLQVYDNNNYVYTDEANTAQKFANDIEKGYLIFLYILWVIFNFAFRVRNTIYTYNTKIVKLIPRYSKKQKFKISLYENLIEICVSTAIYPFNYPEYGDCFECTISFMCDVAMYSFVNVGFYIALLNILLLMFESTRELYIKFLKTCFGQLQCAVRKDLPGLQCFIRFLATFLVFCVYMFALAAFVVTVVDYISTVYSAVQLLISIIFYFALLCDGDVAEGQAAPEEQHSFTGGNQRNNVQSPNGEVDQTSYNDGRNDNKSRRKKIKGIKKIVNFCFKLGTSKK